MKIIFSFRLPKIQTFKVSFHESDHSRSYLILKFLILSYLHGILPTFIVKPWCTVAILQDLFKGRFKKTVGHLVTISVKVRQDDKDCCKLNKNVNFSNKILVTGSKEKICSS